VGSKNPKEKLCEQPGALMVNDALKKLTGQSHIHLMEGVMREKKKFSFHHLVQSSWIQTSITSKPSIWDLPLIAIQFRTSSSIMNTGKPRKLHFGFSFILFHNAKVK